MMEGMGKKVIVLDGSREGDSDLEPIRALLIEDLKESGAQVQSFALRQIRLAHCIGCFGCWLQTPGICVEADYGREILRAILQSDRMLLFTPIVFGGYSSHLKKIVDRWVPFSLPYFGKFHGEIHHKPRYLRFPRLMALGIQRKPDQREADIFKAVVGRNAINFHAPSYAAEVMESTDPIDTIRSKVRVLLSRNDPSPLAETLKSLIPSREGSTFSSQPGRPKRALLIVGSPKTKSPSTSGVLGNFLLDRLKGYGWETESLTLKASLGQQKGAQELLSSVERADLILFCFPLYIDALPFLVTKALELIGAHMQTAHDLRPQRLLVVCNNGFPEAHQNALALALCHCFAVRSGISWAGGLAMGAGEALSGGQPLTAKHRSGPPVKHVIQALDLTAAAIAEGQPVPDRAVKMIAKTPIPLLPFSAWRWIFIKGGTLNWHREAARHGVSKLKMLDRPLS
jgi:multimeric flavodoxin WrbA